MPDGVRGMTKAMILGLCLVGTLAAGARATSPGLADDTDRAAFRSWFTFLADAQFERRTADVTDCASLIRHAYREALRAHTPAWYRTASLPLMAAFPDVRHPPAAVGGSWSLFRISRRPERYAEFADAATIIDYNARIISRDASAARPGDLLYFRQDDASSPAHLMVVVGGSRFDPERQDWVVYHTGPDGEWPGEVRKVSLADLARHPSARWRPVGVNRAFVGVARLAILDRER